MKKSPLFLFLLLILVCFTLGTESSFAANDISVLSPLTLEKIVGSSEKYDGSIVIKNAGDKPARVRIYQTDYLFYADGSNIYGPPGSIPASNAKWITLSTQWITIPAMETAPVNYSVQVPSNPDLHGTYWSMLMVEPQVDTAGTPQEKGKNVLGVQTTMRYGVQVVTNIKDTGTRHIEFSDKKIITENGKRYLQLDIKNTGERWLNPSISLQLYSQAGKLLTSPIGAKNRIFPTCSVRHKIGLPDIPKGKYKALIIVDNGDQYVFGANYELMIE